jgi:RHH-type proline utilization regulon transcriptional repressor/proline dehydrogenase/delta 1-pyrroline-5-carboxylate dehydrogenase
VERLRSLSFLARDAGIPLTVDAEEADRLELSLRIFERVHGDDALGDWPGIGLAVQAYQKRAPDVIDWLIGLAAARGRVINVRLVKGAYWDTEIKRAQEQGLEGYPVYTRKINTDLAYLVCARRLLEAEAPVYPQFATHNAHTVASVLHLGRGRDCEFQRLHGMGEELYDALAASGCDVPCRVYAPVGRHKDLLPYLVRRLLENGANTSFVNRIVDEDAPVDDLVADPVERIRRADGLVHPRIPLPPALYGAERPNSRGPNLADAAVVNELGAAMEAGLAKPRTVVPRLAVDAGSRGETRSSVNPARRDEVVGRVVVADDDTVDRAVRSAVDAFESWNGVPVERRAAILRAAADLYEAHRGELMALAVHEAGKTLRDAVAEVREAVDFLRYYAAEALGELARPRPMPGPTGERNELRYTGRGPFVCISPWNFPLAIFTGQVAAALVAGNPVLAKPAEQTPLIAGLAVELLHRAGVPRHALQFLPGDGETVGAALVAAPGIAGVAFTGGTETAWAIQRALAAKRGPIPAFIAETGGQNAMIVDSSALPEQVVLDVFQSAFQSAGQRCSALRVLLVQSDVADRVLTLLAGYMETLAIGDPALPETDVGPVIDEAARDALETYVDGASLHGRVIHRCRLGAGTRAGTFVAPVAVEVDGLNRLGPEVFGPVLHVVRYDAGDLDAVIDGINGLEYGLTLGIQSRIDTVAAHILSRVRVGNAYVNRNMVGAVVGVQPFGGRGLSGTGPKAGGPHYLHRFVNEMTVTTNTAAVGGNAALLSLEGS